MVSLHYSKTNIFHRLRCLYGQPLRLPWMIWR